MPGYYQSSITYFPSNIPTSYQFDMYSRNSVGQQVDLLSNLPPQTQCTGTMDGALISGSLTPPLTPVLTWKKADASTAAMPPLQHSHLTADTQSAQLAGRKMRPYSARTHDWVSSLHSKLPISVDTETLWAKGQRRTSSLSSSVKSEPSDQSSLSHSIVKQPRNVMDRHPCPLAKQAACTSHFSTSGHATRHARKHTGKKDWVCPCCTRAFTRKDNMGQHHRTHRVPGPVGTIW